MGAAQRLQAKIAGMVPMLQREIERAASAWTYFTRTPLPRMLARRLARKKYPLEDSAAYAPFVGILAGAAAALVFVSAHALFKNTALAILLGLLTTIVATGAIHEDGTAHFFEAFWPGQRSKNQILAQLEEPRIGAVGSLVLALMLLIKFQALLQIDTNVIPFTFIAAHASSRFAAMSFIFTNTRIDGEYTDTKQHTTRPQRFVLLAILGVLPLLLVGNLFFLILVPLLWVMRTIVGLWFTKQIGGWTADCLSTVQQVTEIAVYLLIVVAFQYTPFS